MAVSTNVSFLLASVLAITTLAASQTFKAQLAETKGMTILGGGIASMFFMFVLTAIGNLEGIMMGKGFELQLIPEGNTELLAEHLAKYLDNISCFNISFYVFCGYSPLSSVC